MVIRFLTSNKFMPQSSFTGQIIMYILFFPEPDMSGALYFSDADITEFLYCF